MIFKNVKARRITCDQIVVQKPFFSRMLIKQNASNNIFCRFVCLFCLFVCLFVCLFLFCYFFDCINVKMFFFSIFQRIYLELYDVTYNFCFNLKFSNFIILHVSQCKGFKPFSISHILREHKF